MNILFISNGHGEDAISRQLVSVFLALHPQSDIHIMPLVGGGQIFDKTPSVTVFESRWNSPSGGFIGSFSALFSELKAGVLKAHYQQIREARFYRFDMVVAIGDFFALMVARLVHSKYRVFIPTAKSDLFQPHFSIERFFIRRWASRVFTRDQVTADSLVSRGISAKYSGNIMMDMTQPTRSSFKARTELKDGSFVVGILPGSREEAYTNFEQIAKILHSCPKTWRLCIAAPPQLDLKRLQSVSIEQTHTYCIFQSLLDEVDMVIGLSGTANEQCVGCGIPVIAFQGAGPQTTRRRFAEQSKLLLGGVRLVEGSNSAIIAKQVIKLSKDKAWFAFVHDHGVKIMGASGASQRIVKELSCIFES